MQLQKRLSADILGCGINRVNFDPTKIEEIKKAITRFDIAKLINQGIISAHPMNVTSRFRARIRAKQKRKGRRTGHGSRKGKASARSSEKRKWINAARAQRELLKLLREKGHIAQKTFVELYAKVKGGYFRSTQHIKIHIKEQGLGENHGKK